MDPRLVKYLADLAQWQADTAAWAAREVAGVTGPTANSGGNGPPPPPPTRPNLNASDEG